jgi:hypothetical protein
LGCRADHQDALGQRPQQVVEVAVAAAGLVADLEAIRQALEDMEHLLEAPHLGAAEHLSGFAEDADGNAFAVNVEPDVEQSCLHKSESHNNSTSDFRVIRRQRLPS